MEKLTHQIGGINKDYLNQIKEILPEVFTEVNGKEKVDIDKLLTILGEDMTDDFEKYEFKWKGKRESLAIAGKPSTATLRLCMEESKNADVTQNLYIEGDNLEVLKLLQRGYHSQVKMIYIDPPYNTGNDFIYEDDFSDNIANYKEVTMQMFRNNPETSGRFHTKWLNMMYPRLRLAKTLLRDDGVIFISIDDNEVANLRKICDEVFGEDNFVAQINWKGRGGRQDSKLYAVIHEYILCYAKNISEFKTGEEIKVGDVFPKFDEVKKRNYKTQLARKWGSNSKRSDRPNLFYPITTPDGTDLLPMLSETDEGCWRWSKARMTNEIEEGNIEFVQQGFNWIAYEKIYEPLEGEENTKKYTTWIDNIGTATGTDLVKNLFSTKVFDYPKPLDLVRKFILMADVADNDLILDFFSGSATTAHAVMQLNAEDGGNRRFICVQLPELCDEKSEAYKAGYKNICEIGKERIRRAGDKIKDQYIKDFAQKQSQLSIEEIDEIKQNAVKQNDENQATILTLTPTDSNQFDNGFRVLKLDNSNLNRWDTTNMDDEDIAILEARLLSTTDTIKKDRTDLDLCFEVMLKLGLDLNEPITEVEIQGKKIYSIGENCLILICLDKNITEQHAREMLDYAPGYAVFAEHCFGNSTEKLNVKLVLEKARMEVRAL